MNFYWDTDEAIGYGIVNISVANIRAYSIFQSELTNQTLLGTIVSILDERDQFYFVQNWDGYKGWISKQSIVRIEKDKALDWQQASRLIVVENYGVVREGKDETSKILTDLVPFCILKRVSQENSVSKVELPDERVGYVNNSLLSDEKSLQKKAPHREEIAIVAEKFLGIPYLWGGNSSKGFDCSGFVQTVFRLINMEIPRDSGPMSRIGQEVKVKEDLSNLVVGDLLFFGKTVNRINHVAIYMGNGSFIHSRGMVRINNLKSDHPLYDDYLKQLYVKTVRIMEN